MTPTSIAQQTAGQLGGQGSLLERQRRDHVELDSLLRALRATTGPEQDAVLQRLARLVFPHAYAEETVIWPVVRAVLPDGERITLQVEQEHQTINELFSELDRTPGGPERDALLDRLVPVLQADVREEEDELLPRLQAATTPSQLRRLGLAWELVRRVSPTRPHAVVARRPPGNLLSALPLTVLDRSRDALDEAARRVPAPMSDASRTASRGLARVAGLVEHLPPLRWGERPSTRVSRTP